jgi:farnesyl-diphosphate farnesyltransferase
MQDLLKQVSRSFYLTLRVLPRPVRAQLSLAYLLARASDTVVDTQWVEFSHRREALLQIRSSIRKACEGQKPQLPDCGEFIEAQRTGEGQGSSAERLLLERLGEVLVVLGEFSAEDRRRIRAVLDTITHGQEMDLVRFGDASADRIVALATDEELDTYTFQVAGCVGEFWTHMCRTHIFPAAPLDDELLIANGILFGKGLQLVNILRDLPRDLRNGRCYIPQDQLLKYNLQPRDLLDENKIREFRPLYSDYLRKAEEYLHAGWQYTIALPFRNMRIRLACSWPILIGLQTLKMLYRENVLDDRLHILVSQSAVWRLILRTVLLYPTPKAWNRLVDVPVSNKRC